MDVGTQVLSNIAADIYGEMIQAYNSSELEKFLYHSARFFDIANDTDTLLATNENFILGRWTYAARSWARSSNQTKQMELNARVQITSWGSPNNSNLIQYAYKVRIHMSNYIIITLK